MVPACQTPVGGALGLQHGYYRRVISSDLEFWDQEDVACRYGPANVNNHHNAYTHTCTHTYMHRDSFVT